MSISSKIKTAKLKKEKKTSKDWIFFLLNIKK